MENFVLVQNSVKLSIAYYNSDITIIIVISVL